jgi:tetratricopeptide (TPR) repeat protein
LLIGVAKTIKKDMIMNTSRSLAVVCLASSVFLVPGLAAAAGGGGGGGGGGGYSTEQSEQSTAPAPKKKTHVKKKTPDKSGALEEFRAGYQAAYTLIYDKLDYEAGIAALRALGHDEDPDVANLIGYASRKLGRYDDAKIWYERALAIDPNHTLTWSYLGMWYAEQGNMLKAKEELTKVESICGNTDCREYKLLQAAIDGTVVY